MPKAINITGQRFGRLVALERADDLVYSGKNFSAWRCQCDCGEIAVATTQNLRRGLNKSCGCLRRESGKFRVADITGQRFGRLVAVERKGSRYGKSEWACDCDCGTKGYLATQNMLQRGSAQSCGCLRDEFLRLGPSRARVAKYRPLAVKITYPVPAVLYPGKSDEFNAIMQRRYQFKWERVEFEARKIERGSWKEPACTPFVPLDQDGNRIERLDLIKLAAEKRRVPAGVPPVPDTPASFNTGASLADRVRTLTDEEWARLTLVQISF